MKLDGHLVTYKDGYQCNIYPLLQAIFDYSEIQQIVKESNYIQYFESLCTL